MHSFMAGSFSCFWSQPKHPLLREVLPGHPLTLVVVPVFCRTFSILQQSIHLYMCFYSFYSKGARMPRPLFFSPLSTKPGIFSALLHTCWSRRGRKDSSAQPQHILHSPISIHFLPSLHTAGSPPRPVSQSFITWNDSGY